MAGLLDFMGGAAKGVPAGMEADRKRQETAADVAYKTALGDELAKRGTLYDRQAELANYQVEAAKKDKLLNDSMMVEMADIENQFPADRSYDPLDKKIAQYKAARGVYAKFGKLDLLEILDEKRDQEVAKLMERGDFENAVKAHNATNPSNKVTIDQMKGWIENQLRQAKLDEIKGKTPTTEEREARLEKEKAHAAHYIDTGKAALINAGRRSSEEKAIERLGRAEADKVQRERLAGYSKALALFNNNAGGKGEISDEGIVDEINGILMGSGNVPLQKREYGRYLPGTNFKLWQADPAYTMPPMPGRVNAGGPQPASPQGPPVNLLREGVHTRFRNNQVWTLRNGKPIQVE